MGCKISKKSVVLARDKKTRREIQTKLASQGIEVTCTTVAKDLGVGTTGAYGRRTIFLNQRVIKARGKVRRISILAKADKRAAKLFNSGAYPQALYGKEAVGICPSTMSQMRAMGAECANAGGSAGKCTTTLIWLALSPAMDPAIRVTIDQITMWFYLLGTQVELLNVYKAWAMMKQRASRTTTPWAKVCEPIGATICTLMGLGWTI